MPETITLDQEQRHPLLSILLLSGYVIGGLLLSQFLSLLILYPFMGEQLFLLGSLKTPTEAQEPVFKLGLFFIQGFSSFLGLFLAPVLYFKFHTQYSLKETFGQPVSWTILVLSAIWMFSCLPITALLSDWNAQVTLPESLSFFENWAKSKEEELKYLTDFLTTFHSPLEWTLGVLVISIIPALGEEYVFRGGLQPILQKWIGPHGGIWMTGIVFSAIHMQFYGFLPRAVLGIWLGYLAYTSQSLWPSIVAHFTNNFVTLIVIDLEKKNWIEIDLESSKDIPLWFIVSSIVSAVLIWLLLKKLLSNQKKHKAEQFLNNIDKIESVKNVD